MRRAAVALAVGVAVAAGALAALRPRTTATAADPAVVSVAVGHGAAAVEQATGFAAAPGRVVTVAHVLDPRATVAVGGAGGAPRRARVVRIDPARDLAVLAVDGAAPAGRGTARVEAGARVRVLVRRAGRTTALAAHVRRTVTARVDDPLGGPAATRPALELAARVRPGDSGAPVIDRRGRIAGVVFARSDRRPGTAYAVAAAAVRPLLR